MIWAGEIHGTNEAPEIFSDLVCHASATHRPVVVALERSQSEQAAWDAFVKSEGLPADVERLISRPPWTTPIQDGRNGLAMVRLALQMRLDIHTGRVARVKLIVDDTISNTAAYEHAMAKNASEASADLPPNALVLVLSGSAHAKRAMATFQGETYPEAASTLDPKSLISLLIKGKRGEAWNCTTGCGPHTTTSSNGERGRGVWVSNPPQGFDGVLATGKPNTTSIPANPEVRKPTSLEQLRAYLAHPSGK